MLQAGKSIHSYEVRVASMEPRLSKGHIVYCSPSEKPRPGDDVCVQMKTGGTLLREFVSADRGTIRLAQLNPRNTRTIRRGDIVAIETVTSVQRRVPAI